MSFTLSYNVWAETKEEAKNIESHDTVVKEYSEREVFADKETESDNDVIERKGKAASDDSN